MKILGKLFQLINKRQVDHINTYIQGKNLVTCHDDNLITCKLKKDACTHTHNSVSQKTAQGAIHGKTKLMLRC